MLQYKTQNIKINLQNRKKCKFYKNLIKYSYSVSNKNSTIIWIFTKNLTKYEYKTIFYNNKISVQKRLN